MAIYLKLSLGGYRLLGRSRRRLTTLSASDGGRNPKTLTPLKTEVLEPQDPKPAKGSPTLKGSPLFRAKVRFLSSTHQVGILLLI